MCDTSMTKRPTKWDESKHLRSYSYFYQLQVRTWLIQKTNLASTPSWTLSSFLGPSKRKANDIQTGDFLHVKRKCIQLRITGTESAKNRLQTLVHTYYCLPFRKISLSATFTSCNEICEQEVLLEVGSLHAFKSSLNL